MLQKFETINFKSFKDHVILDFTAANYNFNKEVVKDDIVKCSMIYGENASGKSNIGLAVFDITNSITNKESDVRYHKNYSCLNNDFNDVYFKYTFKFKKNTVEYEYIKSDYQTLLYESLTINNQLVLRLHRKDAHERNWGKSDYEAFKRIGEEIKKSKVDTLETLLEGTEPLLKTVRNPNLSMISYVKNNANLDYRKKDNKSFREFVDFVDRMLWFRSVESNSYIGLITGNEGLAENFLKTKTVKKLENFLNRCGIQCELKSENNELVQVFSSGRTASFFATASSGTKSLALYFYWTLKLEEHKGQLIFIDEFDSTYHTLLAQEIIKELLDSDMQVVLTSHNTNLISNDILRPDAYFILKDSSIKAMNRLTKKELREVHNLEKLYLANTFTNHDE